MGQFLANASPQVKRDYIDAFKGDAVAQNKFGNRRYRGEGVPQDYHDAVWWYRKAAEQGNSDAQYNLGDCYANGEGVQQDSHEAAKWYYGYTSNKTYIDVTDAAENARNLQSATSTWYKE